MIYFLQQVRDIKDYVNVLEFNSIKVPFFVLRIRGVAQIVAKSSVLPFLCRLTSSTWPVGNSLCYSLSHGQEPHGRGMDNEDQEMC